MGDPVPREPFLDTEPAALLATLFLAAAIGKAASDTALAGGSWGTFPAIAPLALFGITALSFASLLVLGELFSNRVRAIGLLTAGIIAWAIQW